MTYHKKYNFFYRSKRWQALRDLVFVECAGICQECLKKEIITEGKEVHHIKPIESEWEKRYDRDNLTLLCSECHRLAHERSSPLQEFNKFWEELNGADS